GDRPHSQHHNPSRLIMTSGHPTNYTTLTDVTCIGLYNEHIEEVFDRTPVGTQVKLI
ncbi:hypothetical protein C8N42_1571, partial [Celeribacter persicus]